MNFFLKNLSYVKDSVLSRLCLTIVMLLILSGCDPAMLPTPPPGPDTPVLPDSASLISDINDFDIPPDTQQVNEPETSAVLSVIINTTNARANIRGEPSLNSPVTAKGEPGAVYQVISKSADDTWWQICCIPGPNDAEGAATEYAWISDSVVEVADYEDSVVLDTATLYPLFTENMDSRWSVDWICGSDRCEVNQCEANVYARVYDYPNQSWLPVEHRVIWDETCFSEDSWVFEIDQYNGSERTGQYNQNFLYSYWIGKDPGTPNGVYSLDDGRNMAVWCSGPYTVEIDEGDGWTTVYEGETCHEVKTGMLVLLDYTKRWLFTGEFDGEAYERAYFGDSEQLTQYLTYTNADLLLVQPKTP